MKIMTMMTGPMAVRNDEFERLAFNKLKRCVIKQHSNKNLVRGNSCSVSAIISKDTAIASEIIDCTYISEEMSAVRLERAMNKLSAVGYATDRLNLSIIIGYKISEKRLNSLIKTMTGYANRFSIDLCITNLLVSKATGNEIIITVNACGKAFLLRNKDVIKNNADIVMVNNIALDDTSFLAYTNRNELADRLPMSIIESAIVLGNNLRLDDIARKAYEIGVIDAHYLGYGGIEAAAYELSVSMNSGFRIDVDNIKVMQESIEIAEIYGLNPYTMNSYGSMLLVVENDKTDELLNSLNYNDNIARKIGVINTDSKDKLFIKDDRIRHLDRP